MEDLKEVLSWLLVGSEQEAVAAVRRIRNTAYDELLSAARQSRERGVGEAAQTGSPSSDQRLPPFSTLASVSGAGELPSRPHIPPSLGSEGSIDSYSSGYFERPPQPPGQSDKHDRA